MKISAIYMTLLLLPSFWLLTSVGAIEKNDKGNIEIETILTKEYVQPHRITKLAFYIQFIESLPESEVLLFQSALPAVDKDTEKSISKRDPQGLHKADAKAARIILKYRTTLMDRSDEILAKWDIAILNF